MMDMIKKVKFKKSKSLSRLQNMNDTKRRQTEQNSFKINEMSEPELAIAMMKGKTRKDLEKKYEAYPVLETY